ncbi:CHAT domain-containing protein [Streptomyces sp. NPDC014734]|uniref:CHAT domain-containing protein n=1 Tax=Streptomyces sp. NPDC014734 TaxID=3364886 RepID=UPI0036F511D4
MTIRQMMEAGLANHRDWQNHQDPEALRTALRMWSTLSEVVPSGSALRPPVLTEFGRALRGWARLTDEPEWLDRAVEASAEAVRESEEHGHLYLDEQLSNLGLALWERFEVVGRMPDLEAGILAARRSIALTAHDAEPRPGRLANLAQMLLHRFDRTRSATHRVEAFDATRDAAAAMPPGHPQTEVVYFHLSEIARTEYGETRDLGDLDLSIEAARHVIGLRRADGLRRALAWAGLARSLLLRASWLEHSGTTVPADELDDMVRAARRAVELGVPDDPELGSCLWLLARSLVARAEPTLDRTDLDEAAILYERLLAECSGTGREASMRVELALCLALRHHRTGDVRDARGAVDLLRAAARGLSDGDEPSEVLLLLGSSLHTLYTDHTADVADLDEAIEAVRRSAARRGDDAGDSRALATLGELLRRRFEDLGDRGALDEAVAVSLRAGRSVPAGTGLRPLVLEVVSGALRMRAVHTGDRADFDASVDAAAACVAGVPAGGRNRATALNSLGSALQARYEHCGGFDDLRAALDAKHEAVRMSGDHAALRAMCLSGLGVSLLARFDRTGDGADLAAAVDVKSEAVRTVPPDHPAQDRYLANLSLALLSAHRYRGHPGDLDRAVETARLAVDATPHGSHRRSMNLSNLGVALMVRFDDAEDEEDLHTAIRAMREATTAAPDDHPDQVKFLSNLTGMLRRRSRRPGREHDLREALDLGRRAVARCPADHASRAACLFDLGDTLREAELTAEAVDVFREAARLLTGPMTIRLTAALRWGGLAAADRLWTEARQGYGYAVGLLPQAAWHGLDRDDRAQFLADANGLAPDAAAVAIEQGDLVSAVELLELGRGVLLAQALDARTELDELRELDAGLADRMEEVRHLLDRAGTAADLRGAGRSPAAAPESGAQRREAAAEWDLLLVRARALLPEFLLPPSYRCLREAACDGPVVIVNIGRHRCDALIVTAEEGAPPRLVRLERITREAVDGWARDLVEVFSGGADTTAQERNTVLGSLLARLWTDIAEPVLTALDWPEHPEPGREPRLWWCPTGALGLLPLHAAGVYPRAGGGPARPGPEVPGLLDRAVCSYAPTLRALVAARNRPAPGTPGLLGVAVPGAPGMTALRHAVPEVGSLREEFPTMTALVGPRATRESVLEQLQCHSRLHFAGHGSQYSLAGGALHCTDAAISLRDVTALRLSGAELAFLSACETARGITDLADEFAHLAGGLNIAGFSHVIATQWTISDLRAPQVARDFYRALRRRPLPDGRPLPAAAALRTAVLHLRAARPESPALWAPYLHTGP